MLKSVTEKTYKFNSLKKIIYQTLRRLAQPQPIKTRVTSFLYVLISIIYSQATSKMDFLIHYQAHISISMTTKQISPTKKPQNWGAYICAAKHKILKAYHFKISISSAKNTQTHNTNQTYLLQHRYFVLTANFSINCKRKNVALLCLHNSKNGGASIFSVI